MHHGHTILASLGRREETHREATHPSHEIKILNIRKQNRSQRVSQKKLHYFQNIRNLKYFKPSASFFSFKCSPSSTEKLSFL